MTQKILMVCLGNICRSPLAEGILSSKLNPGFVVDSAGTGNWHAGEKPDHRAVKVALRHGIDISKQRARQIKSTDFDDFDLIFAMDSENFKNLIKLSRTDEQRSKIKLILGDSEVPDPFFGDESDFENVFELLDAYTDRLAIQLNSK